MFLRLGPVIGQHVARRQAARNGVHRRQPAMDLAFHEVRARIAERRRQRLDRRIDQLLVAQVDIGQRIGAGDQEVEHAMAADVVPRALDIDAAAAERFRHPPGAGNLLAPERLVEQQRHAQVVRRPVEIGHMLDHRRAQLLVVPAHGREPVVRQAHHDEVEVARLRSLAVHHVELVAAGVALADLQHAVIELDVGVDLLAQALDDLFVAVLDGIEADIAVDIHHEVLQRIQSVGVVAFGGEIGSRHHLSESAWRSGPSPRGRAVPRN